MKRANPQVIAAVILLGLFLVWNISTRIYLHNKQPILGIWKRQVDDEKTERLFLIPESSGSLETKTARQDGQGYTKNYSYMDNFEWHEQNGVVVFIYHIPMPQRMDVTRRNNTKEEYRYRLSGDRQKLWLDDGSGSEAEYIKEE